MAISAVAEALPYTLLSLPRYAKIMGINPVHFAGGFGTTVMSITTNSCNDVWARYSWQHADSVSHYDIAEEIRLAEVDIARELGWWPAPVWIAQDVKQYPRHYRRDAVRSYRLNVRAYNTSVRAEFAKVIAPGQRAVSLIENVTVVYSDEDGDGFTETATVTATTTVTEISEIKVYFADYEGGQDWEIRPYRRATLSGGTFTAIFDAWLFIDPAVASEYPTTSPFNGIDLDTTANYVTTVDVYREYNDTTATSSELFWEPLPVQTPTAFYSTSCIGTGSACVPCTLSGETGCLHIRDALLGIVVPTTATYNSTTGQWENVCTSECRDPDFVKLWYQCGDIGNNYLRGRTIDPLSFRWARAIAAMATARLERPFCSCGNVAALTRKYQTDCADLGNEMAVPETDLDNPFGTRYGEIMAWREVRRERHIIRGGGAI